MDHLKQRIEDGCLVEQPAFCTAACPFHLNVPQFVDKLQRGNFSSAYRAYHKEVVFPGIVSRLCEAPCKALCPQARAGEAIDMPELERAAVAYTSRRSPNSYNLPEREQRIAIIGAGISGLTCALRLCSNKYRVTVYEKTDRIGGDLWNRLEPAFFLEEIEREFKNESYTLQLNTEILSLDTLEADAVYVATGAGGSSFGLAVNGGLTKSSRTGIFLGGALCGSNPVEAIADGLQAVTLIEQFLKTGAMADAPKMTGTLLPFGCREGGNTPAVRPKDGMLYSKEEAVEEAKRCLLCSCDACKRSCDLMEYYNKLPPRIAEEVYFTIHPAALWGNETFAKRLMETCNQCGACKDACPEQLDLGELIQDSRRIMRGLGKQAWVFHDYWLRDMENAMKDAHLVRKPDGIEQSEVVFFPGCQLGASDPRYVLKSYEWILRERPDAALWLSCCGVPALWAGAEAEREEALASLRRDWTDLGCPEVIFACPTCKKTFAKDLPDIKGRFLLEWMAERGFVPERALGGEEMAVFDPCASRNEPELQKAARTLAERSGASLIPLRDNGKNARCCSWGGHVSVANPDYARKQIATRIGQSDAPYITYCANCRDLFADAGKPCVHLLDILFNLGERDREAPTCSNRRENRLILMDEALRSFWGETPPERETERTLLIDEALRKKLSKDRILEEEAEEAVRSCEQTGRTVINPETGAKTGHALVGNFTIWVTYQSENGKTRLLNCYSHRMHILAEEKKYGKQQ